ncbi:ABC transporter substrate-binding protein [Candidatus Omnitrophota bacterium]
MKKKYYITIFGLTGLFLIATMLQTFNNKNKLTTKENNMLLQDLPATKPAHSTTNPIYGGTLVWGTINAPTLINPVFTKHSVSASLMDLIFNKLVRINASGAIEPDLAKEWHISEDQLTYTFTLKKNIFFHDGIKCTAEDVLFTYQEVIKSEHQSPRNRYQLVDKFKAPEKYIFQVTLKKPYPTLLYELSLEIIPQHILKNNISRTHPFNYHPIGTGPFTFISWDQNTNEIQLKAYSDYHEGRPFLDKILVKTYADIKHLWNAFMRQEIDLVKFITKNDYQTIKNDPLFKGYRITSSMYYALVYNLDDPILSDIHVRTAIAQSINIKGIINKVYNGNGILCTGHLHPQSIGFNKNVKALTYNPLKAKIDLMHRGWQDQNQDGILEKHGINLKLNILVDKKNAIYRNIAAMIRQDLAAVGIQVKLILYNDAKELTPSCLKKNNAQAWLRMYKGFSPEEQEIEHYSSSSWYSRGHEFAKIWKYINKQVDLLFEFSQTSTNKDERKQAFYQIHKLIYEDQPACFLFFPSGFSAVTSKFKNTDEHFSLKMPTYTIKNWFLIPPGQEGDPVIFNY